MSYLPIFISFRLFLCMVMKKMISLYVARSLVVTITLLNLLHAHAAGTPLVRMYQIDEGPHTIGSNATVISEIKNGARHVEVLLFAKNSTKDYRVGYIFYQWNKVATDQMVEEKGYEHLSFSSESGPNLTRRISWNFYFLPERYKWLNLTTEVAVYAPRKKTYMNHSVLHVLPCESPKIMPTSGQDSTFKISTHSPGHFNDKANCSCIKRGQVLFNMDGSKNKGIATCGSHTEWIGCEDVQCWSGPRDINAIQLYHTVNASDAFGCNFVEGFPVSKYVRYRLNNMTIPSSYALNSADNRKIFSCEVMTNYTEAVGDVFESPGETVIVYYSPENLSISNHRLNIELHSSTLLNFTFFVNSKDDNLTLTIAQDPPGSLEPLSWERNYTEDTLHIYEFQINITSNQDYGFYQVCVETGSPIGKGCKFFTVAPMMVSGLSTLKVGLITGGFYLLLVTVVGIGLTASLRIKKTRNGTTAATPEIPTTEHRESHKLHIFPRNEVRSADTIPEPPPPYEIIDPVMMDYEDIELPPAHELVDHRMGYETVNIIDSHVGYEVL